MTLLSKIGGHCLKDVVGRAREHGMVVMGLLPLDFRHGIETCLIQIEDGLRGTFQSRGAVSRSVEEAWWFSTAVVG